MSISAINCTPIKPNVSFGSYALDEYNQMTDFSDRINEQLINSSDIKKPVAILASLVLAGFASYAGTKGVVNTITEKNFAKNAGVFVEKNLKSGTSKLNKISSEWTNCEPKSKLSLDTIKKYSGKALFSILNGAKTLYKKVAYSSIPKETVNPERANRALANVVGTCAATATVTEICTKDSNGDGVTDIMQKSQNAYTNAKTSYGETIDKISTISEIIQTLT